MTLLTPVPPASPLPQRLFYAIPVIGWIARDVAFGTSDNIWYALVIALTAVVLAVAAWGLPALVLIAVALVPVCFALLIALARP